MQQAKNVVEAGKKLIKTGLVARTWGNVSARISEEQFVITPSGRAYESLTPAEIVTVNIADGGYQGKIRPSSEKGLHAAVYRRRPEISFIIHTHQTFASVVSALHFDIERLEPSLAALIGSNLIPCAAYGLPGSQKLKEGVVAALSRSKGRAILMANHGALCLGENCVQAFKIAAELEQLCADLVMRRYLRLSQQKKADWDNLRAYYLEKLAPGGPLGWPVPQPLYSSEKEGDHLKLYLTDPSGKPLVKGGQNRLMIALKGSPKPNGIALPEAEIHRIIYRRFKKIRAIIHIVSPDTLTFSQTGQTAYPLLDDFAQIVGVNARVVADGPLPAAVTVAQKLRGRSAVMIKGNGAFCCGPSRSDAEAAAQILDKNCRAIVGTALFGGARPILPLEALLMRFIYLTQYSRRAVEKWSDRRQA